MNKAEIIVYKGIRFRRYPASKDWASKMYYVPDGAHRKKGVRRLHQEIWKDYFGPIPADHHIHHRDGNPLNNHISNLECISQKAHHEHHKSLYAPEELKKRRWWFLHWNRKKAVNWHRSDEGRAWHSEHGKEIWENKAFHSYVCDFCGVKFQSKKQTQVRFCSNRCKAAQRRKDGKDLVSLKCLVCKKKFQANRYDNPKTCSGKCAQYMRRHLR